MNLGIAITDNDMPKSMNYKNAKLACQKLGKQWRIPTFEEFDSALNEYGMTELENNTYWTTMSGTAYPSFMTNAWQALEPSNCILSIAFVDYVQAKWENKLGISYLLILAFSNLSITFKLLGPIPCN